MKKSLNNTNLNNNRSIIPSDYRSSVIGPSDSEKESRRDSDGHPTSVGGPVSHAPRLGVTAPSADSESGGDSHSPSPRASRRQKVCFIHIIIFMLND